jgi:DNA-binding MarR family transcriptional regulator
MNPMPPHIPKILSAYDTLMEDVRLLLKDDLPPAYALIIAAIGEEALTPKDIRRKKFYVGTNCSYALRLLELREYLTVKSDRADRRQKTVRLTEKGLGLAKKIRLSLTKVMAA